MICRLACPANDGFVKVIADWYGVEYGPLGPLPSVTPADFEKLVVIDPLTSAVTVTFPSAFTVIGIGPIGDGSTNAPRAGSTSTSTTSSMSSAWWTVTVPFNAMLTWSSSVVGRGVVPKARNPKNR